MKNFFLFFISIYLGLLCVELIFSLMDYLENNLFLFGLDNFLSPLKFSILGALLCYFTNNLADSNEDGEGKK